MSAEIFHFQGQQWVLRRKAELMLTLGHSQSVETRLGVDIDALFVPP